MKCRICGHTVTRTVNCNLNRDLCDDKNKNPHYHCSDNCWCTRGGCWPEETK